MDFSGAAARRYAICVSCGPEAHKCVKRNALCRNPRIEVNEKAYEKAARAWMLARRSAKIRERNFLYNYYDYYRHFYEEEEEE